jgi:hypothetical protein
MYNMRKLLWFEIHGIFVELHRQKNKFVIGYIFFKNFSSLRQLKAFFLRINNFDDFNIFIKIKT